MFSNNLGTPAGYLKEKQKQILSGEDYQRIEAHLNQKQFLRPLDSDNAKANIYSIRQKSISRRYCDHRRLGHWPTAILEQNCNKGRIISFHHRICKTYLAKKRKKGNRKSVNQ
ncbi:hypothetical protein GLAREA_11843 [Glarea lozoyensis ATCC 20868]|uniref:Uncharacterized protein n=1 Tax=Glarea lozoyensis (strain ATCC 20868 / MF5171) TaxID=1116229 RepID=S3CFJ8_GLAL2|nr:uncharacterized protein GLAREA_11843 [Glarea lozoyensis ATCC 20868]EPE25262.1 hypothetical protein GLAREA_11843 [Glarea lozoyensis ATCC 20868]